MIRRYYSMHGFHIGIFRTRRWKKQGREWKRRGSKNISRDKRTNGIPNAGTEKAPRKFSVTKRGIAEKYGKRKYRSGASTNSDYISLY